MLEGNISAAVQTAKNCPMIYSIHPFDWIAVIQICKLSKFVTAANCLCVVVNKSIPPPVAAAVPPEARRMACATATANIFFG